MKEKMFTDITIIWNPAAADVNMNMSIIMTNRTINTSKKNLSAVDVNMNIRIIMTNMTMNTNTRNPAAVDVSMNIRIIMTNMIMNTNTRNPAAVDASMGTHITMTNMSINTSQRNLAAVDANMDIHIIITNMTMWGMIMGTGYPIIRKGIRLTVSVNCVILTRDTVISVVRALQTASAICLTLTVKRKFIS